MNIIKKYYAIVLAMLFWSASFILVKIAYIEFNPINLITLRVLGAALIFFIIGWSSKKIQPIKRGDLKFFIFMAFVEPFLYFMGESHAMLYISSTLGSVIISTIPLFTPFAGYYLLKERITPSLILGIILSFSGIFMMVSLNATDTSVSLKGILLMFIAVSCAVFFPVFLSRLTATYSNVTILAYQNLFGFILFLPFFMVIDFKETIHTSYTLKPLLALGGLIVFASVLGFVFFTNSIKYIGVTKSNTFINLMPVFTALIAYFTLKEALGFTKMAGIVLVISGLFISQLRLFKRNR